MTAESKLKRGTPKDVDELGESPISRRQALLTGGRFAVGAAFGLGTAGLATQSYGATYDFTLRRGEAVLKKYGLKSVSVKSGVAGQTIFSGNYKARGWIGGTTVLDSIGSKYSTKFVVKKIPCPLAGFEMYQATFKSVSKVIANRAVVGITLRSFFAKGQSRYVPLADYTDSYYKTNTGNGNITVYDHNQNIAMMRRAQGRVKTYFCNNGFNCPRIGKTTHSAGELIARLLVSNAPGKKLQWLPPGAPCYLVMSISGRLFGANIYHKPDSLMMAIPGHGQFGMTYKTKGNFELNMPGESFGLEKNKILKITLTKK